MPDTIVIVRRTVLGEVTPGTGKLGMLEAAFQIVARALDPVAVGRNAAPVEDTVEFTYRGWTYTTTAQPVDTAEAA